NIKERARPRFEVPFRAAWHGRFLPLRRAAETGTGGVLVSASPEETRDASFGAGGDAGRLRRRPAAGSPDASGAAGGVRRRFQRDRDDRSRAGTISDSTPVETNSQQPGGYGSVTITLIQQSNSRHGKHCEALGWRGVIGTRNTETWMLSFRQALGVNSGGKVSDVVPIACRAAANAGIRSVCVTNFSWDFIYAEYIMEAGNHHRAIVWQIAEDYSHCDLLLRLPGYCPMPAFRDLIDVPLVVRRLRKSRSEVRKELGIGDDVKVLIFNFGGQPAGWNLKQDWLPDGWFCLVCGASDNQELPPNYVKLAKDVYTPDFIAASDCMLGKVGYGTVSESLAYKVPFVFVRRDYFNEEPFLRNMLEHYQGGVEMIRRDLLTGRWAPYLERALTLKPCYERGIDGGEIIAGLLQHTAKGKYFVSHQLSGARRLRDAIVLGYQLQRVPGRDMTVPDWYSLAENEIGFQPAASNADMNVKILSKLCFEEFEILHGEFHGLPDTVAFIKSLSGLAKIADSSPQKCPMREHVAASALFDWEVMP
ncbi:L-arabinokinase-like, partial [Zingiber officinale]|uniref:L-arabinokinase-like n=1 Tax=Zingiber officinale TaxID=94328 RepID=UPI001C4D1E55